MLRQNKDLMILYRYSENMCIICVDLLKEKITASEAMSPARGFLWRRAYMEMRSGMDMEHAKIVIDLIKKALEEEDAK